MATIDLGRVGFVNKGTYSGVFAYKLNDVVVYNSGTYACIQANTGQLPTVTAYWQVWVANDKAPLDSPALVNPTINGVAQSGYTGFKNLLINGGFDVWQRGTSGASGYVADRWFYSTNGATQSKNNFNVNGSYNSCLTITETNGTGAPLLVQGIEGFNKMGGKILTVSFWIYRETNTVGRTFNVSLFKNSNSLFGSTIQTIEFQNDVPLTTWTKVTKTFNALPYDTTNNILTLSIGTVGGISTYHITGVQLEEGSVATPFEQRPLGLELSLCQRYYQFLGTKYAYLYSGTTAMADFDFKVPMRVAPTISYTASNVLGEYTTTNKSQIHLNSNVGVNVTSFAADAEL